MIVEAGLGRPIVGAKSQHDPDLVGQHDRNPLANQMTRIAIATMAIPAPVPKPPGRRDGTGPDRAAEGPRVGACGPRPRRLGPTAAIAAQGPPRGPLPQGPPP
jgi:hypothetical protein